MIVNEFELLYRKHKKEIDQTNYVRGNKSKEHWVSFYKKKLGRYQRQFGNKFNLIIKGREELKDDYYIIPFELVEKFFVDKSLAKDMKTYSGPRWSVTAKGDTFKVWTAGPEEGPGILDARPYHGNLNLLKTYLDTNKDVHNTEDMIPLEDFKLEEEEKEKLVRQLSYEDIVIRLKKMHNVRPDKKRIYSTRFVRDPLVTEAVKRYAKGFCMLCGNEAPFKDKKQFPYLEVHHINWLANGGNDTIRNAVALCPNCHKKMHIKNEENDEKELLNKAIVHAKSVGL